jgi:hypothetical protein
LRLVGDVHDHVLRIGGIERAVRHRQSERAAVADRDTAGKASRGVQRLRSGAEFRRQINAGHLDLEFRGEPAGRAADPGADIEDALAGS